MCWTCSVFFFNHSAPTEIYTLSLHDALPIWPGRRRERLPVDGRHRVDLAQRRGQERLAELRQVSEAFLASTDRKSTRLNSSHMSISYAVFCLKKKKHRKKI